MTSMELKRKISSNQTRNCRYRIKNRRLRTSSPLDSVGVGVNSKTLRSSVRRTKWLKVSQVLKITQASTSQNRIISWRNETALQTIRYLMTPITSNLSKVRCWLKTMRRFLEMMKTSASAIVISDSSNLIRVLGKWQARQRCQIQESTRSKMTFC